MGLQTGEIIEGKYRIVRLLGEGGMGAVYEGENVKIQRRVAIKILHANVAESEDAVRRFEKEAQAAGRIGSDHITEVLDLGSLDTGDRFMVMEYMEGDALADRITARERLSAPEAAQVVVQLLEGLKAAHAAGIIHRDLKPDNVFLLKSKAGRKDFVKILDFGISKFSALSGDSGMSMTRTGAVMGTPYYMSPEQAKGSKEIDARSDLYAVGVILYEAVTGQVPFDADTFNELIFKIVLDPPVPPESLVPDLDPGFAAIINKGMAREPSSRFQSADEFQQALIEWMETGSVPMFEESLTAVRSRGAMGSIPDATSTPLPSGTPASWANDTVNVNAADDDDDIPMPPKSKPSQGMLIAVTVIGGLIIIGGGAFGLQKLLAAEDKPPVSAAPSGSASTKTETPAPSAEPTASEAAPKEAPSAAPAATSAEKPEPTAKPKATTKRPPAHRAPPRVVRKPPPPKPTATKTAEPPKPPPKSTGRTIRTVLD